MERVEAAAASFRYVLNKNVTSLCLKEADAPQIRRILFK